MDDKETKNIPTGQSIAPTQTKASGLTDEDIKEKIAKHKERLAELTVQQEVIDNTHVYFEKCPVRFVVTKDDNGNEITGFKDKNKSNAIEHFNTLNKLTATQDILLHENIVNSAISAQPTNQKIDKSINTINQVLADYEPKDSIEAKLILQEHTLYAQAMRYLSKADNCDMLIHADFYMKTAIKLFRLHNETVESLNRHRRGGTQKVVVQHVQVNEGGKAVVGGVFEGAGYKQNNCEVIP